MDKELQEFIHQHKLDKSDFFNAEGRTINSCYNEMKKSDKLFAFNTTPCQRGGHTIRDRKGHCIVCNPASIAFIMRSRQVGYIYIACSKNKQFTKVGMSTEKMSSRISKLNSRKVGNTGDWEVIESFKCPNANQIELLAHSILDKYKVKGDSYGLVESYEIFRCGFQKAHETIEHILEEQKTKVLEYKTYVHNKDAYKFRNLI